MARKHLLPLLAAAVWLLTVLPYRATLGYGLINLDDYQYTVEKSQNTGPVSGASLAWLFRSFDDAIWMPVTRLSYLADFKLWGGSFGAMHAVNVAAHGVNAVLLLLLLLQLFAPGGGCLGRPPEGRAAAACALAALLWSLHPLRVESVAWVASRKDVLAVFFMLAAWLLWLRRLDRPERSAAGQAYGVAAVAAFALAGMSKPTAMTWPLLAGLLELFRTGRVRWRDYAVPVFLACVVGAVAGMAQRAGGAMAGLAHVPLYGRAWNAAAALGIYTWKTLCPTGLAVQCINRWPDAPRFGLQGLAISAVLGLYLAAAFLGLFRRPLRAALAGLRTGAAAQGPWVAPGTGRLAGFVGAAFALAAVAPTLGLSAFGLHAFADRFTYLPALGLSLLAAAGLTRLARGFRPAAALAAAALLLCGVLTDRQVGYWRDEKTLFSRTLEFDLPNNAYAHGILGCYSYEVEHDLEGARRHFEVALRQQRTRSLNAFHPVYIKVLAELGETALAKEETQLFTAQLAEATQGDVSKMTFDTKLQSPSLGLLLYALIAVEEGDLELARMHLDRHDRLLPDAPWALFLRGKMALKEGEKAAAVRYFERSLADRTTFLRHRFFEPELQRLKQELP